MTTHIKILNHKDIEKFDSPPEFYGEERKRFFYLPKGVSELVESFRTTKNKVGFILQFGYFKASKKFYVAQKFHEKDIIFVANILGLNPNIDFKKYAKATYGRHQNSILKHFSFHKFEDTSKLSFGREALSLSNKQIKPRLMFMSLVDFLRERKIEIPKYNVFAEVITNALRDFEKALNVTIEKNLSIEEKGLLDNLLEFRDEYVDGDKQGLKIKRYKNTLLKKTNQSTRPSKIKENIRDLNCLESIFQEIKSIADKLNLSPELIQY
jgi:hypothetical protein